MLGESQTILLPSWIGLAETTLLLAPSPIIVWATVQNSYSSARASPAKSQVSCVSAQGQQSHRDLELNNGADMGWSAGGLLVGSTSKKWSVSSIRGGEGDQPRPGNT